MATMLVVDDERDITQVLADFLTMRGHDVTAAQSGKQALSLARQRKFDVVFLDIAMPGMDGNETLQQLRKDFPGTIVIMISGVSDESIAIKSLELGAFDYIRKPFEFSRLDRVVALSLATRD
jgi:two-component system nitrogen regulation response regulator NtrX